MASVASIDPARQDASASRIGALEYLVVLAQLGVLALIMRQFQIESAAYLRLVLLVFGGFAVHALLPLPFRLPFFLALSLGGIVLVLGAVNGLWLVALGLVLIGICHLPIRFSWRLSLIVVVAAVLALQRASWLPAISPDAIWPILGSMFMFRLIVYLYDLRFEKSPATPLQALSYFFMLPNVCFPLFPVIDYKAFRRNYYDADAYAIYQTGVDWIVRGVLHLVLYRLVYYYLTLAPAEVRGPMDLAQYLIANFLLYLRVSGTFHLVVGMLYLFGFRLPETHHEYLLASSFTDFWRRINIYWKDFMLRIFYFPAYFRLRKLGPLPALVIATLFVFVMTWLLHAYQWFWLRGTGLLVSQDMLFWTILGLLVVINAIYEDRHGRERTLGKTAQGWRTLLRKIVQTFATFTVICTLWSFWTCDSLAEWFSLWSALRGPVTFEWRHLLVVVVALIIVVGVVRAGRGESGLRNAVSGAPGSRLKLKWATLASFALLLVVGVEQIYSHLPAQLASTSQALRSGRLSRLDNAKLDRGYYENLVRVDRFNSQLWDVYMNRPVNWLDIRGGGLKQFTGDFAQDELKPGFSLDTNYGTITTNRWGMRDQDYELKPAPGVFRMAILGPSTVMGWGVADGTTFEALIEKRLNEEAKDTPYAKYEILNFGVPGYQPPQQLVMLDRALRFEPKVVMYVATGSELLRSNEYLAEVVRKGIPIPYEPLRAIVANAGIDATTDETTALKRLAPVRADILKWTYRRIADEVRRAGAVPVWIFIPQVRDGPWREETPESFSAARAAGFLIIDLSDVYKGQDLTQMRLAEWDYHPSTRGHEVIAAALFNALRAHQDAIFAAKATQ